MRTASTPDLSAYLRTMIDAEDTNVIDAKAADVDEDEEEGEQPPLRYDSRGRVRRGGPADIERAAHMREVAAKRRIEREAERQRVLRAAIIGASKNRAREAAKSKRNAATEDPPGVSELYRVVVLAPGAPRGERFERF